MVVSAWCLDTGDNTEEGGEAGLEGKQFAQIISYFVIPPTGLGWGPGGGRGGTVVISGKGFEVKMLV